MLQVTVEYTTPETEYDFASTEVDNYIVTNDIELVDVKGEVRFTAVGLYGGCTLSGEGSTRPGINGGLIRQMKFKPPKKDTVTLPQGSNITIFTDVEHKFPERGQYYLSVRKS